LDIKKRFEELERIAIRYKDEIKKEDEVDFKAQSAGKFILLSNNKHTINEIMSLYYNQEIINKEFNIDKIYKDLSELEPLSTETIRGHIMALFIASLISRYLKIKLQGAKYEFHDAMRIMRRLRILVSKTSSIIEELSDEQNKILDILQIPCELPQLNAKPLGKKASLFKLRPLPKNAGPRAASRDK
jgi:hypothetical protein